MFNDILLPLCSTGRVAFDFGSEGSPRGNSVGHNYPYDAMQGRFIRRHAVYALRFYTIENTKIG
jgi:hypothetical protein